MALYDCPVCHAAIEPRNPRRTSTILTCVMWACARPPPPGGSASPPWPAPSLRPLWFLALGGAAAPAAGRAFVICPVSPPQTAPPPVEPPIARGPLVPHTA